MTADEQALAGVLQRLPRGTFIGSVYRLVPLNYLGEWASAEGARRLGGRFNPPEKLGESIYGIAGGFGLLYTASNPITCLFECQHVLRGGSQGVVQSVAREPKILLSFHAELDRVLDLRDANHVAALELDPHELLAPDDRYDLNEAGKLTALQRVGAVAYKTGRFSGIAAPSQYSDPVESACLDFLPGEVKLRVHDPEGVLGRMGLFDVAGKFLST